MRSKWGLLAIAIVSSRIAWSGVRPRIELPKDSPVVVLSADYPELNESARGGALVLDVHAALSLQNSTERRIRGITLLVTAQDVTPGGKGSVTISSLDVGPRESFPVRIDLRLLRPLQAGSGVPVQIGLDGVLFDDLSFYGPDKLNSRRMLTVAEWEARRDRRYFKAVLAEGGPSKLQQEILGILAHQTVRADLDVQIVRGARATNYDAERQVQFAFLQFPQSPVQPMDGMARVAGNEARAPRVEVMNRSDRSIRYLEIGWILKDRQGHEFLAGAVPAELSLGPGQKSQIFKDATLKFPQRPGLEIDGMTGFVSNVEFADGAMWIPSRSDLADPRLHKAISTSAEEQRLLQIYQRHGLKALTEDLKKF